MSETPIYDRLVAEWPDLFDTFDVRAYENNAVVRTYTMLSPIPIFEELDFTQGAPDNQVWLPRIEAIRDEALFMEDTIARQAFLEELELVRKMGL